MPTLLVKASPIRVRVRTSRQGGDIRRIRKDVAHQVRRINVDPYGEHDLVCAFTSFGQK